VGTLNISLVCGFKSSPILKRVNEKNAEEALSDGCLSCPAGARGGAESGSRVSRVCGHGMERSELVVRQDPFLSHEPGVLTN
jgi:hypothetical protein